MKKISKILLLILMVLIVGTGQMYAFAASPTSTAAVSGGKGKNLTSTPVVPKKNITPNVESSSTPDTSNPPQIAVPKDPVKTPATVEENNLLVQPQTQSLNLQTQILNATTTQTFGPNLISNPSVETASSNLPIGWHNGSYGTNARSLTYPVAGYLSEKAIKVAITSLTSGDAKWYFDDVPVTPGKTYQISDYYISNISNIVDIRYKMNDGTYKYIYVTTLQPSSAYKNFTAQFVVPQNAVSLTVFHLIQNPGNLTTDEYSLNEVTTEITPIPQPDPQPQPTPTSTSPNLISNPDFEIAGTNGMPLDWNQDRWANNTAVFSYPALGVGNSKAVKVEITSWISGDAKWYFKPISVAPGTYTYSDQYISNRSSDITVEFLNSNGTYSYKGIAVLPASNSFTQVSVDFTVPENVRSITIFHLIDGVGALTIDNASLQSKTIILPKPVSQNLISNPNLEIAGTNGAPLDWNKNSWGTITAAFSYPVTGVENSKAAKVTITSRTTGDAKWYFKPISVAPGTYTYSDQYISNRDSYLTVQYLNAAGAYSYKDIALLPPSNSFASSSIDFTVPAGTQNITVMHLINGVGFLTIDSASLKLKSISENPSGGIFDTGAVSLTFDDAWISHYSAAMPKLDSAGLKGTFYIITKQLADYDFTGFMSKSQVQEMYGAGHEIGAHTQTHPHLPLLTADEQQNEISGSLNDLKNMNINSVSSFSYPYGEYDTETLQIVKNAGFSNAVSTMDNYVAETSDKFQLPRLSVEINTALNQVKQWIDNAIENKQWAVLTFHGIDNSGDKYSVTPDTFNGIVDYLTEQKTRVVTIAEGIASVKQ